MAKNTEHEPGYQRVEKRPGAVFSTVIFVMVFAFVYLFYPQISMVLPFAGVKVNKKDSYANAQGISGVACAVVATVEKIERAEGFVGSGNTVDAATPVLLKPLETLKGTKTENFYISFKGGTVLFKMPGTARQTKYIVSYPDTPSLKKGKTYLFFLNGQDGLINGKHGIMEQNDDGTFTDAGKQKHTREQICMMLEEAKS